MTDFDVDDVSAMRRQGDFREFMRQQVAAGNAARQARTKPPAKPPPPPGHQPGAWPPGTRPPSPPAPAPGANWTAALAEYRTWSATADHDDDTRYRCDCGACPEGA